MKKFRVITIQGKEILKTFITVLFCVVFLTLLITYLSGKKSSQTGSLTENPDYIILSSAKTGMACYQENFSSFLILPPGNTLRVQVFRRSDEGIKLVTAGITVYYSIIDNTTSADKINFWDYAAYYGYNLAPNIGITGNGLSGRMQLSADRKYFEASAIPVTPFNDGSKTLNPYQFASITVTSTQTGEILRKINDVVIPVSNELDCSICHGDVNTDANILRSHDRLSGTNLTGDLAKGVRYKCADCHKDNALGTTGLTGLPALSQAIHGYHADKMSVSTIEPKCYSCHPGPVSKCYRGAMYVAGIGCINSQCHGDMQNIADSQKLGREAWIDEPDCSECHGALYATNDGALYSSSFLVNSADSRMNNIILCTSCHNSPHAEWVSSNRKDNLLPIRILGHPDFIRPCTVCHREGNLGRAHNTVPTDNTS